VKDYPGVPQEKAQIVLVEAGPEIFTMFKAGLRRYAEKALAGRNVGAACGEVVESGHVHPVGLDYSICPCAASPGQACGLRSSLRALLRWSIADGWRPVG
jgi:hypothetical protein